MRIMRYDTDINEEYFCLQISENKIAHGECSIGRGSKICKF